MCAYIRRWRPSGRQSRASGRAGGGPRRRPPPALAPDDRPRTTPPERGCSSKPPRGSLRAIRAKWAPDSEQASGAGADSESRVRARQSLLTRERLILHRQPRHTNAPRGEGGEPAREVGCPGGCGLGTQPTRGAVAVHVSVRLHPSGWPAWGSTERAGWPTRSEPSVQSPATGDPSRVEPVQRVQRADYGGVGAEEWGLRELGVKERGVKEWSVKGWGAEERGAEERSAFDRRRESTTTGRRGARGVGWRRAPHAQEGSDAPRRLVAPR